MHCFLPLKEDDFHLVTDCFIIAETFPRLFLYNTERASDRFLGLCDHQVCCLICYVLHIAPFF